MSLLRQTATFITDIHSSEFSARQTNSKRFVPRCGSLCGQRAGCRQPDDGPTNSWCCNTVLPHRASYIASHLHHIWNPNPSIASPETTPHRHAPGLEILLEHVPLIPDSEMSRSLSGEGGPRAPDAASTFCTSTVTPRDHTPPHSWDEKDYQRFFKSHIFTAARCCHVRTTLPPSKL
ncbi:uncharacterized protein LY89DRAFT_473071 [Mollisia scopiformis]|uniref:Uncharacterized protein n=1 Tax=Mollisia scopiformis TaxID=149040 RepID=A0A194XJ29_MOLSC|nr:uncharacterized protein LY89DRAFT_473071 [Mollisia scopiformis]KUJ20168.1 hypothetical protein LY89DRAFT_473071 [Mollisia scopiformis]